MCTQFTEMDAKVAIGGNPRYYAHDLLRLLEYFRELLRVAIINPPTDGDDTKEMDPLVGGVRPLTNIIVPQLLTNTQSLLHCFFRL
jgi:hypothetical protein